MKQTKEGTFIISKWRLIGFFSSTDPFETREAVYIFKMLKCVCDKISSVTYLCTRRDEWFLWALPFVNWSEIRSVEELIWHNNGRNLAHRLSIKRQASKSSSKIRISCSRCLKNAELLDAHYQKRWEPGCRQWRRQRELVQPQNAAPVAFHWQISPVNIIPSIL